MKKLLLNALLLLFCGQIIVAQDTTIVQTLDFNDITKRRGWYVFPPDTTYERVLMYYTLKCDAATTQDNFACGEWDYTTYTNLYDYQNVGNPHYILNGNTLDSISYSIAPTYSYYQQYLYHIIYDAVNSQIDYSINTGTFETAHASKTSIKNNKAQYLLTASELTTGGLTAGSIDKLALTATILGSQINHLRVKIKQTVATNLDNPQTSGFDEVYHNNNNLSNGLNTLNFITPFVWDGSSNIIIELNYSNQNSGIDNKLSSDSGAVYSSLNTIKRDGYLELDRFNDYVTVPDNNLLDLTNSITLEAWVRPTLFTANVHESTIIGKDADENGGSGYVLRFGSNGVLEFLLGTNGGWKTVTSPSNSLTLDDWQHVAATYDGSVMKLYINGQLVNQTANTNIASVNSMDLNIGAGYNGGSRKMKGNIDEVRIWNTSLSQIALDNWKKFNLNNTHPNIANLVAHYQFDDETNLAIDNTSNGLNGNTFGYPVWKEFNGNEMMKDFVKTNERLNFTLTQGSYTSHIDSILITDTVQNAQLTIVENTTFRDINVSGITITPIDTIYGWQSGWNYVYDENGSITDSVFTSTDAVLYNSFNQTTFQIQNYVTPYGIGLNLGSNGFRWVYDVTDYQRLLHDTVELSAGNQQELIDLKFVMIKGTPPRDVHKIEQVWNGIYNHIDIANDVTLPAVNIDLDSEASSFRIKTRTSGHQFGGFQNCAEFCPKLHHIDIDGTMRFQWNNWKSDCAENPIIAQGGTWVYDRAGWCPGTFTDTYDHELTPYVTPGTTFSLNYGMETTVGGMVGQYVTSVQLVSYGANNFNLDARVDEIISPNDWEYHNRVNPICADPKIVIQNTGATTLTTLKITYKIQGGTTETYNWSGNLAFMEKEEVTLPISSQSFWSSSSVNNNVFKVSVSAPNGGTDEYANNNSASSTFERPVAYDGKFVLKITTNNAGHENSYTIKDDQGNVVMSRGEMSNNTTYKDTIDLPKGCYVFDLLDIDQDGMSFFANNDGNGSVQFRWIDSARPWVKNFNTKFGSFIKHYFSVGFPVGVNVYNKFQKVVVSPNPSNDIFNLSITGFENETVNVGIYNVIGEVLLTESVTSSNDLIKTSFDLRDLPSGIYFVRVFSENAYTVKKIIKN